MTVRLIRRIPCLSALVLMWMVASLPSIALADEGLLMRPGSVLAVAGFGQPHTVLELAQDGRLLAELTVVDPPNLLASPSGLTVMNGKIWLSGDAGVYQVDAKTGELGSGFSLEPSITALADDGQTLWVGTIHPDRLSQYGTDGRLISSVTLQGNRLVTGLEIDGDRFLISSYATGHVHVFDRQGVEIGVIETGLQAGNLTGVSLDPKGDSLWLTLGTGANEVAQTDLAGNLLNEFPGLIPGIKGLEVLNDAIFADGFESGTLASWIVLD